MCLQVRFEGAAESDPQPEPAIRVMMHLLRGRVRSPFLFYGEHRRPPCSPSLASKPMSIRHLDRLLEPGSVAVIGASNRVGSVGATVWRNLRAGHFAGPIFAVNPKHASLDG